MVLLLLLLLDLVDVFRHPVLRVVCAERVMPMRAVMR